MQRSKINDYFSFPHKIDMRPYKVEHLMDYPEGTAEDIFELTGILVHSGTAESGHYYSYIRERPSCGSASTWVEFNDDCVLSFDPSCIEANCFGGIELRAPDGGSFQFDKSWSAYMLFYQRSSVLQAQQKALVSSGNISPLRLIIQPPLHNQIVLENEMLLRKYCLYDEHHAPFVLRMLDNVSNLNQGRCSDDHILEKEAMGMALSYLDQVVTRTKDLPDLSNYILILNQRFQACQECCVDFLEWLTEHPEAFRSMLMRNPDQNVRSQLGAVIFFTLRSLKQHSHDAYGSFSSDNDSDEDFVMDELNPGLFHRVLAMVSKFWEFFHLHSRCWPEYFGLLFNMAGLGIREAGFVLDAGYLVKGLEMIRADSTTGTPPHYARMFTIISKRSPTKPVGWENVIALVNALLKYCDLEAAPVDNEDRQEATPDDCLTPLLMREFELLTQIWVKSNVNILLDKLLRLNQNETATQSIVAAILRASQGPGKVDSVFPTIRFGIRKHSQSVSAAPFLRAALTYCSYTNSYDNLVAMIQTMSSLARQTEHGSGSEYLRFFKDLIDLQPVESVEDQHDYYRFVVEQIPIWAPSLLTYYDSNVRTDTEDYIQQIIFRDDLDNSNDGLTEDHGNDQTPIEVVKRLGVSCLKYLNEEHVRPRVTAIKATLLSIQTIITLCKPYYDEDSDDDLDLQFFELSGGKSWKIDHSRSF
jgi:ubiquitin carboxyl-terminal hydrolase 34